MGNVGVGERLAQTGPHRDFITLGDISFYKSRDIHSLTFGQQLRATIQDSFGLASQTLPPNLSKGLRIGLDYEVSRQPVPVTLSSENRIRMPYIGSLRYFFDTIGEIQYLEGYKGGLNADELLRALVRERHASISEGYFQNEADSSNHYRDDINLYEFPITREPNNPKIISLQEELRKNDKLINSPENKNDSSKLQLLLKQRACLKLFFAGLATDIFTVEEEK